MKITKVTATDRAGKRQVFCFGESAQGREVLTAKGGRLNSYLEFSMNENAENARDVEVFFLLDDGEYSLCRLHGEDGSVRTVLKKKTDGSFRVVARNKNALACLEGKTRGYCYVNNIVVEGFGGELAKLEQIKLLYDVRRETELAAAEAQKSMDAAASKVRAYASEQTVTFADVQQANEKLRLAQAKAEEAKAQLAAMTAQQEAQGANREIEEKLREAQQAYDRLLDYGSRIEESRALMEKRRRVSALSTKIKALKKLEEQRAEADKNRAAVTDSLDWQQNEIAEIDRRLEEKRKQYADFAEKRSRIEGIKAQLNYISALYADNKKLNELLTELNDKKQQLLSQRAALADRMKVVEENLKEARDNLDNFALPPKSVGELMETVRADVKHDEVQKEIERLQNEITVKESRIAEKESALVTEMKRFRTVAELDVRVTPIKAKDTILQVLDAKYSKLETINLSLEEKRRNFQRALEDYRYRIAQLEDSRAKLEVKRNKAFLRRQEEFKRDVFLNSQKVFNDDASSVFAVNANFSDGETEALDQEIASRNLDRDQLVQYASRLEGAIKEISRHMEINSAEMETLRKEKQNINDRYNEIVAKNSSDAVFNYLKALNSDNGTKYLLDVQQQAVRSEAELAELKKYTETMRARLSSLKARLSRLAETQSRLGGDAAEAIAYGDRLKEGLEDVGERLSAGYEQYLAVVRQTESVNSKLEDVNGAITEASKTVKVNETQIKRAAQKAQTLAGSQDIEKALADFRYDEEDTESEIQALSEARQTAEKETFKSKLAYEKAQWLYENKCREHDLLFDELQKQLADEGLTVEQAAAFEGEDDSPLQKEIARYDAMKESLARRIESYRGIVQNTLPTAETERKRLELQRLERERQEQEKQLAEVSRRFAESTAKRIKATAAAAEVRTLNALKQSLSHNKMVAVLIEEKIKSLLKTASAYYAAFTGNVQTFAEKEGRVTVDGKPYDLLTPEDKTAAYVSLLLASPLDGDRQLVFEERINATRTMLSALSRRVSGVNFVVDYREEQASRPKTESEGQAKPQEEEAAPQAQADEGAQALPSAPSEPSDALQAEAAEEAATRQLSGETPKEENHDISAT